MLHGICMESSRNQNSQLMIFLMDHWRSKERNVFVPVNLLGEKVSDIPTFFFFFANISKYYGLSNDILIFLIFWFWYNRFPMSNISDFLEEIYFFFDMIFWAFRMLLSTQTRPFGNHHKPLVLSEIIFEDTKKKGPDPPLLFATCLLPDVLCITAEINRDYTWALHTRNINIHCGRQTTWKSVVCKQSAPHHRNYCAMDLSAMHLSTDPSWINKDAACKQIVVRHKGTMEDTKASWKTQRHHGKWESVVLWVFSAFL